MNFRFVFGIMVVALLAGGASAAVMSAVADDTAVNIDAAGLVTFAAGRTEIKTSLVIDGFAFEPVKSSVAGTEITFISGEKFLLFDDPVIRNSYSYRSDGSLEQTVFLKEARAVSYKIDLPDGGKLIPADDGKYRVFDPSANIETDGYIVISKAVGFDAKSQRVDFEYQLVGDDTLSLVFPKMEISYPLVIDPVFERTYDLKLLLHMNYMETGNTSLSDFPDSSRYFHDTQVYTSVVSTTTKRFGNASFNISAGYGSTRNLTVKPSSDFALNNENWSINFFFDSTDTIHQNEGLFRSVVDGNRTFQIYLTNSNTTTVWVTNSTGVFPATAIEPINLTATVGNITLNQWNQITVLHSNDGVTNLYFNGSLVGSQTQVVGMNLTGTPKLVFPPSVVDMYGTPISSTAAITGYIDEVSFWKGGTARNISNFYPAAEYPMYRNASATPTGGYADDNHTVMLMHFNDVDGGRNFTDQTGKIWSSSGSISAAQNWSGLPYSPGALFFGGNAYLYNNSPTVSPDFNFGTGDWTIDFWINATNTPQVAYPLRCYGSNYGYNIYVNYDATSTQYQIQSNNSLGTSMSNDLVVSTSAVTPGQPHHVTYVRNGTSLKVYQDGWLVGSSTIPASYVYNVYNPSGFRVLNLASNVTYIEEFRVSKGVARWIAGSFTVPSYAYEVAQATSTVTMVDPDPYTYPQVIWLNDTSLDSVWTENTCLWTYTDLGITYYSEACNLAVSYWNPGAKTAQLTTFNNNMSSTGTLHSWSVHNETAGFSASPTHGTAALEVTFTDESQNLTPITSYYMDFGDGDYSSESPPWLHVYDTFGVYSPNLTITTAYGSDYEYKRDYIVTTTEQNPPSSVSYPKYISISVLTFFGSPIKDANVTMQPLSTSSTDWDWLMDLLGMSDSSIALNSTMMMQKTDINGVAEFYVMPTTKYSINITASGYTFNVGEFTPVDSEYTFRANMIGTDIYKSGYNTGSIIGFSTNGSEINETAGQIHVVYTDTMAQTTSCNVSLWKRVLSGNTTTLSYVTSYNSTAAGNFTKDFTLLNTRGQNYVVKCTSNGATLGTVTREFGVTFKPGPISLGIPEDLLIYVGIFGIVFISLFFVRTLPGPATIVVMFFAWVLYFMGWWIDLAPEWAVVVALIFWSVVAIFFNIMIRSKKTYTHY